MLRPTADLAALLETNPTDKILRSEYAAAAIAEAQAALGAEDAATAEESVAADEPTRDDADNPPHPVEGIHVVPADGARTTTVRVLLPGISDSSLQSIKRLCTEHLGLLLGSDKPLRLNSLSGQIEHDGKEYDISHLVTLISLRCEERVHFETQRLDEQGRYKKAKLRLAKEAVRDVVVMLARENRFSPVAEWLESLPAVEPGAIQLAATEGLGLTSALDMAIWRRWLISAVSRVLPARGVLPDGLPDGGPGGQADSVLVLVSPVGGERKSSLFAALAGNAWFGDTDLELDGFGRKDAYLKLHSKWIYELAELEGATGKKERARMKAFITSKSDNFRAPYDAVTADHPRSVMLCATTNSVDWLHGDTAQNRRFWPTFVGHIDGAVIGRLRDQIWSEAVAAYRAGEPWHLTTDETALLDALRERHEGVTEVDARGPLVRAYVDAPCRDGKALLLVDIARGALRIEPDKFAMAAQKELASILRSIGWHDTRRIWQRGASREVRWHAATLDATLLPPYNDDQGGK